MPAKPHVPAALAAVLAVAGCATGPAWRNGEAPALVTAVVETVVTTDPAVDADDPALWADARDPRRAVLFATDKSDGLYVHDLDGRVRQFLPSGAVNNVDLRTGFVVGGREQVLVAASNDQYNGVNLYLFDPDSFETRDWGFLATGDWVPYGFCMGRRGSEFHLIANAKSGEIRQWRVRPGPDGTATTELLRTLKVGSQPEGCVVDETDDALYVGEEDVGVWRFAFDPAASPEPVSVAVVDRMRLTDDVEGLTIMRDGPRRYLIVSSQGDDTFGVFRIDAGAPEWKGRFAIVASDTIDGVTQTDGVDAWSGPIGAYPEGLLAFHDDADEPLRGQQNYKLVDWRAVKRALDLD